MPTMLGQSQAIAAVRLLLQRYAACDVQVLIEGETGTGKEVAARELHYAGARGAHPFVPVNCGAIPDRLIESELFGHGRGAFTDAKVAQPGVVDHARGGTLFLDEVDALSAKGQVAFCVSCKTTNTGLMVAEPAFGGPLLSALVARHLTAADAWHACCVFLNHAVAA